MWGGGGTPVREDKCIPCVTPGRVIVRLLLFNVFTCFLYVYKKLMMVTSRRNNFRLSAFCFDFIFVCEKDLNSKVRFSIAC